MQPMRHEVAEQAAAIGIVFAPAMKMISSEVAIRFDVRVNLRLTGPLREVEVLGDQVQPVSEQLRNGIRTAKPDQQDRVLAEGSFLCEYGSRLRIE